MRYNKYEFSSKNMFCLSSCSLGCYKEVTASNRTEYISMNPGGFPEGMTITCVLKIFVPDDYAVVLNLHQPRNITGSTDNLTVTFNLYMT